MAAVQKDMRDGGPAFFTGGHEEIAMIVERMSGEEIAAWWKRACKQKRSHGFSRALLASIHERLSSDLLERSLRDSLRRGDGTVASDVLSIAAKDLRRPVISEIVETLKTSVEFDQYAEWLCVLAPQVPDLMDSAIAACMAMTDVARRSRAAAQAALNAADEEVVERFLAIMFEQTPKYAQFVALSEPLDAIVLAGTPYAPNGGGWIEPMLAREMPGTWRYLRLAIGDPDLPQLLRLVPGIVGLAGPKARIPLLASIASTLREACVENRWPEGVSRSQA